MTAGGIQHLEIRQTADKLILLFNGKPVPNSRGKMGRSTAWGNC